MQHVEALQHNRRAIYIALLSYLNPEQARQATDIWAKDFSNKSAFQLQPFITRIVNEFEVLFSRKEIQQSIIKMLLNEPDELQYEQVKNVRFSSDVQSVTLESSHIIFSLLITQWLDEVTCINAEHAFNIKQYIYSNLMKMDLSFNEIIDLKRWFSSVENNSYIKNLDKMQLKKIFHFCYVASCEYLGPVQTDKIISRIVKSIEQTPEAIYFTPKNFF